MLTLAELQRQFAGAIYADAEPVLLDLIDDHRLPAAQRLAIYRTNVLHNQADALADVYPAVRALVGHEFFDAMTRRYVRQAHSTSGDLHDYGHDLADFIAGFGPAQELPYLPGVARLEWLLHRLFHAADAAPLGTDRLQALGCADPGKLRPLLHPSATLTRFQHPVHKIWAACQPGSGEQTVDIGGGPVDLLLWRPVHEVLMRPLDPAESILVASILRGTPLAACFEAALTADGTFAADGWLTNSLHDGLLIDFLLEVDHA